MAALHLWQIMGPWPKVLLAKRTLRSCQSGGCSHRPDGVGGQTPWRGQGSRAVRQQGSEAAPWEGRQRPRDLRDGVTGVSPCREVAKAGPMWGRQSWGPGRWQGLQASSLCSQLLWGTIRPSMGGHSRGQAVTYSGGNTHSQGEQEVVSVSPWPAWGTGGTHQASWGPCAMECPLPGSTSRKTPTLCYTLALHLLGCFYSLDKKKTWNVRPMYHNLSFLVAQ